MKIYLVKRSFFHFRGKKSYEIELAGKSCLERMKENLGADVVDVPPPGEKLVLYPAYPFLTLQDLTQFLTAHTHSVCFRGGFLERGTAFHEEECFSGGLFSMEDYPALQARALRESCVLHAKRGALVEEGARVDATVRLGRGVIVHKGACITGKCEIGENAVISGESVICDSAVGEGTQIHSCRLTSTTVGKDCQVGPYATLHCTTAGDRVQIGSFVECTNVQMGNETRIAHLSCVANARLSARVVVGCGVLFADFDGKQSCECIVGEGAFLGNNCILVAPVRVGAGCFVAAGTTLTRDLAQGDFCIGRSHESVKHGAAVKFLT